METRRGVCFIGLAARKVYPDQKTKNKKANENWEGRGRWEGVGYTFDAKQKNGENTWGPGFAYNTATNQIIRPRKVNLPHKTPSKQAKKAKPQAKSRSKKSAENSETRAHFKKHKEDLVV